MKYRVVIPTSSRLKSEDGKEDVGFVRDDVLVNLQKPPI